jgi:predicted dehydrogenase
MAQADAQFRQHDRMRGTVSDFVEIQDLAGVAIVDPDVTKHANVKKWLQGKGGNPDQLQVFTDYRKMFDKVGKNIDAVFIASPNHHHALPALIAMQLGINVYCEKPVCHDIGEARAMRKMAARTKVATQIGHQGH